MAGQNDRRRTIYYRKILAKLLGVLHKEEFRVYVKTIVRSVLLIVINRISLLTGKPNWVLMKSFAGGFGFSLFLGYSKRSFEV